LVAVPGEDGPQLRPVRKLLPDTYFFPDANARRVVRFNKRYFDPVASGIKTTTIRYEDPIALGPALFVKELSSRGPFGYQSRALALPVDLKVAESADIEPEFGRSLYETQQDASAGTAAHYYSRSVGIDGRFPEDPDSATVLALTDRCNDVNAEQFPQRSCCRIPVKMRYRIACGPGDVLVLEARVLSARGSGAVVASHRIPPVPPKRSVLIEAAG
jgi:hypothetical protein